MFTDRVKLRLEAGKGGNGVVAWTRAKYIPKGGPCGGDGGRGGDIMIRCSNHFFALDRYRHINYIKSEHGADGGSSSRIGKSGKDHILEVPAGTILTDVRSGEVLYDFKKHGEEYCICKGGRGGKGNEAFKTPTNQAPNTATKGTPGQEKEIELELKLIADVGFVGLPNAGKSTLLSAITPREVKIGDYPFTTLVPNLSYIEFDDFSRIYLADIPGLIKGAHNNRGLGFSFLKHVERCAVLIYIIDAAAWDNTSPIDAYHILQHELSSYSEEVGNKPSIIILNKSDLPESKENIEEFYKEFPSLHDSIFVASAKENEGLESAIEAARERAQEKEIRYV